MNCLRQQKNGEDVRYCYPSTGGLYPVDVYIYVKQGLVENLEAGIYEYIPKLHKVKKLNGTELIPKPHCFLNKAIFKSSAFSICFFYNTKESMPKYSGLGYYYVVLDSGIMLENLSLCATKQNLGSCIIGIMDFDKIREPFDLGSNQKYLHCMEVGIPKKEDEKRAMLIL